MSSLTPEKFLRLQELFEQALEIPPARREAWAEQACAGDATLREQLLGMLRYDEAGGSGHLVKPISPGDINPVHFEGRAIPRRLGPYELIEQIGRGGMGAVYRAERVDQEYRSTVAIKLVRPEMDGGFLLSRFRRERQILARLAHPNIARLLDGGTAASRDGEPGIPYIVMEYIAGAGIREHCQARRLSVRERIALFLPVISAVDYAHRNFIIHRDIKPGNILVDQAGVPKLLDFGICKLLMDEQLEPGLSLGLTVTSGLSLMTPDYASPEQALGEAISPVSDVYALGLVLYELLTDQPAHRIDKYTPLGIQEAICHRDVAPPSRAAIPPHTSAALRGDLDNILMKALQKEPARRYESAAALAADLERHLHDQPVQARPDTLTYRTRKFVRRNRLAVGAAAVVALAVGIGGGVGINQYFAAREQEQQARELARDGLFEVFDAIRELPGSTEARRRLVLSAGRYLDKLAGSNPGDPQVLEELADGYKRIGDLQGGDAMGGNLGDPGAAVEYYRRAEQFLNRALERNPRNLPAQKDRVRLVRNIGDIEARLIGPHRALQSYNRAAADARQLLAQFPGDREARHLVADVLMVSGRKLRDAGQFAAAEEASLESLRIFRQLAAENPSDPEAISSAASAESAAGMVHGSMGRLQEALRHYQQAVALNQQAMELDGNNITFRRNLMIAYSHLGEVQGNPGVPNLGDREAAEASYRQMVELARRTYADDPKDSRASTDLAFAELRLAAVLSAAGRPEVRELLEHSMRLLREQMARVPNNVIVVMNAAAGELLLGRSYREANLPGAALRHYAESVRLAESIQSSGHFGPLFSAVRAAAEAAQLLVKAGRGAEALDLLRRAEGLARPANEHPSAAFASQSVSGPRMALLRLEAAFTETFQKLGRHEQAARHGQAALTLWKEFSGKQGLDPELREFMNRLEGRS